jgi:protein SCO1
VRRALARGALLVFGALTVACDRGTLQGTAIEPAREIPALEFAQHDGSVVRLGPADGRYTVVFFGYTRCPDVCPTTLADWTRVKKALGNDASRVRFLFVSVDPERDTPRDAQEYAARFDSAFIGVSGDSATTAKIQELFGVATIRATPTPGHEHTISHSPRTFLLDERGRLVAMYSYGSGWDALASDLKKLT